MKEHKVGIALGCPNLNFAESSRNQQLYFGIHIMRIHLYFENYEKEKEMLEFINKLENANW